MASWKLSKKLKEIHLDPLLPGSSKSSAPSTPNTNRSREEETSERTSSDTNPPDGTAGETTQPQETITSKPGVLVVSLYGARDIQIPQSYQDAIEAANHGRITSWHMPYAVVDFDKVQVLINSIGGSLGNPYFPGSSTQYKFDVSQSSPLTVELYLRNPNPKQGPGRSQDIRLGTVQIQPQFTAPNSMVEWVDLQNGAGRVQIGWEYITSREAKLTIDDFDLLKVVGRGSFGRVFQVRKKDTGRIYAMKTIRKAKIISRSEVEHTLAERAVLARLNNPFLVPLKFSFQSPDKLYFVLAFVNGGELFHHLSQEGRFDINRARFYTAELLCAIECMHGCNIIYRDLKPENILLDYQGHIALCDFGLCKLEMEDESRTHTFCGTPEYLAPELLLSQGHNKMVDWWTFGVLLYEMLTGLPPFYDEDNNIMYRKILSAPLQFPGEDIVPPAARDLLIKLLNRDPDQRLGNGGAAEIKAHPFFHGIDWRKLMERKYEPAFKPNVANALDVSKIDPIFIDENPLDSVVDDPPLSETMQEKFVGFSYDRPVAGLNDAGGSIRDASIL